MKLIQEGPRDARVVLVGEAPGTQEVRFGRPFIGGSGEILDRMLSRCGLRRDECFITNICHVQPPGNDFNWFTKPQPRPELMAGLIKLREDISVIEPNLIIAFGAQPLRFLTDKFGINKWRGSVLESTLVPGRKVIATYHPAHILRNWDYKTVAEFDLQRCAQEQSYPDIRRIRRDLVLNPPREQAPGLLAELRAANWLAVDIECFETDAGWKLACVGFSDYPSRAIVIPCDEPWQLEFIKELCESEVKKVFQNGTFDTTVLAENGIHVRKFEWDTMLAHHSCYPECASGGDEMSVLGGKKKQGAIPKGLAFLTSIHTDIPFYKDDGKLWKQTGDINLFYRYNALDCCATREVQERQVEDLTAMEQWDAFKYEMRMVEPLMACTRRGIKINLELRSQLRAKYRLETERMEAALAIAAGGPLNVKSPKQMQEFLYHRLGFTEQKKRGTDRLTADKDAIAVLAGKYNHPVLRIILAIRQHRDFVERYIDAKIDADGRMRCSFDITGTRTWRLSSRASIYGSGTNLQNIPVRKPQGEGIRRMFEADEGKILVVRDYKQAEVWLVAYMSEELELIKLLNDPTRDVHTENASRIFGIGVKEVSEFQRYLAKKVIHASNYGMGPDRLVQVVNEDADVTGVRIDRSVAQDLINRYFMLYPNIKQVYWKRVEQQLNDTRSLSNAFGFKRTFFGRWDEKLLKEAYAFPPQSTVGVMGAMALANSYYNTEPKFPGTWTLLNVHDSVMVQCPIGMEQEVAADLEQQMAMPLTINGRTFTIPSDCKVGFNWSTVPKQADVDAGIRSPNPLGLRDIDKWIKEQAA